MSFCCLQSLLSILLSVMEGPLQGPAAISRAPRISNPRIPLKNHRIKYHCSHSIARLTNFSRDLPIEPPGLRNLRNKGSGLGSVGLSPCCHIADIWLCVCRFFWTPRFVGGQKHMVLSAGILFALFTYHGFRTTIQQRPA
jgi:hypothetical protein